MRKDFALSPEQRIDARQAITMLKKSGLTLTDAARLALHLKPDASESRTVTEGIDEFLRAALIRRMTTGTLEFYQWHLSAINADWGEYRLNQVTRAGLRKWLTDQKLAPDTIRGRLRAARAMWRWCLRQDPPLCTADPTAGLQLELAKTETQDRFLEPEEAKMVMDGAGIYTAALACVFFAGIRIEEVRPKRGRREPLTWGNVDFMDGHIRVRGKNSTRIQEDLPPNFWKWLKYGRKILDDEGHPIDDGDPVCPFEVKQAWQRAKSILGHWPKNAARHSFITYHVARYKDTGKTSELIGHEGRVQLLHSRYKGRTTDAKAKAFFGIVPSASAKAK